MNALRSWTALLIIAGLATGPAAAGGTEVIKVHSEWPDAQRSALKAAAEKAIPGISIEWSDPGSADMLWGVPVRILMGLAREDLLESYTPKEGEQLRPGFRSPGLPLQWTGLTAEAPAICYNTLIGNETFAMQEPDKWETLAGPDFHLAFDIGPQLQLVDPASAPVGSGLLAGWTAAMGPTAAARFVKALAPNVAAVQTDAAEACRQVARGYSAAGIGVTRDALKMAAKGAPLDIIIPTPVAYDMRGAALRKGANDLERKLADFAISRPAMEIYAENSLIVSRPGTPLTIAKVPPATSKDLESIDFQSLAPLSTALLAAWQASAKGK